MEFRKDVQGLRGIAALFVILFHINERLLSGLFTGVDMFFVISGFIISLGVYYKLENGTYSITNFYARRIKRLMPALFLLIILVMLISYFLVMANDGIIYLKHANWTLLFGANFFNTYEVRTEYFAMASIKYPLLHMWSLAIEEQFYIIFALFIFCISFFKNSAKAIVSNPFFIILVIITVFSFVFGEVYNNAKNAKFVYYMLPSRMGEITLGIIIASLTFKLKGKESKKIAFFISTVGTMLIIYSIFYISKKDSFPGVNALYPCLGTALIIFGGSLHSKNIINRIIANPVTVFFGLISYSMYLYHFAIIAVFHYWIIKITSILGIYLFVSIILLSTISYFLIERPIRKLNISNFKVFLFLFIVPLLLLLFTIQKERDFLSKRVKAWGETEEYKNVRLSGKDNQNRRLSESYKYYKKENIWRSGKKEGVGKARVLLAGNSHASQFYPILNAIAKEKGFSFNTVLMFGCPAIPSNTQGYKKEAWKTTCPPYNNLLNKLFPTYDVIIISLSNYTFSRKDKILMVDNMLKKLDSEGKKVILVLDPLIRNKSFPIGCVYMEKYNHFDKKKCFNSFKYKEIKAKTKEKKLASKYKNVYYYDPYSKNLCPSLKICYNYDKKTKNFLFRDGNHISRYASLKIAKIELEKARGKQKAKENPLLMIPVWLHQMKKP